MWIRSDWISVAGFPDAASDKPSRWFAKPALRSVPFLIHTLYIFSLTVNCLRVDAHFLQVYLYVMYELIFKYILWTNLTLDQKRVPPQASALCTDTHDAHHFHAVNSSCSHSKQHWIATLLRNASDMEAREVCSPAFGVVPDTDCVVLVAWLEL